jgi:hypothetical protein
MLFFRIGNYLTREEDDGDQVLSGVTFAPRYLPELMIGLAGLLTPKSVGADIIRLLKKANV